MSFSLDLSFFCSDAGFLFVGFEEEGTTTDWLWLLSEGFCLCEEEQLQPSMGEEKLSL